MLQEALSNVLRHSGAQEVDVRLCVRDGQIRLEVQDDGKGLPLDAVAPRGLGLVAMRERASIIGGNLMITQPGGRGTLVALEAPMMSAPKDS